jgi:glutamate synthase domain-containing protein 2/glutamate synthase domain-containing protein 1/glutamate synthase domain-containing protein 3
MKKFALYDPAYEHDSCGVGFVVNINGQSSHQIISDAVTILKNLVHRGALGGDSKTGDGAGILIQLPYVFFKKECQKLKIKLPADESYGAGMLFLPQDKKKREQAINLIKEVILAEGGLVLGWRDVPTQADCLGEMALEGMPFMAQVFVSFANLKGDELERKLYVARKCIEKAAIKAGFAMEDFYIPSFSGKTIVYKGMFVAPQFEQFFPDLSDKDFQSALAVVHQRYSTNTFPSWPLAQPFRFLAHNGEINTLKGNINKMKARESTLASEFFDKDIQKLIPVINEDLSDSAIVDNVFELLTQSGRSVEHSLMMMIPEAFGNKYHISQDKRAFYEYHAAIMEPWDGPAAMAFTDGVKVGACLDRNGLRPARYVITKSGKFVLASEVGVLDISPEDVLQKGRLAPGKMILVDTQKQRVIYDNEIKATISRRRQYRRWLAENRIELTGLFESPAPLKVERESLPTSQKAFGYTLEDLNMTIIPMVAESQEPVGSMGNHEALAVLSERPQLLYNYFKQLFAQVTNPPIDPYRENLVMSLMSFVGTEHNLLEETPLHCHQLKLPHPILTNEDMEKLRHAEVTGLKSVVISICIALNPDGSANGNGQKKTDKKFQVPFDLEKEITKLCEEAEKRVDEGNSLLILSDRGVDESHISIPALLASSAVHHHLVRRGKRQLTGLIIETGEAREVMHFATLIGYGASAINPYLAFETIADLFKKGEFPPNLKAETAFDNYITAIKKGLLKVMSKMGVSTIRSYRGAQIFEAIGLSTALVNKYFTGTASRIEGIDIYDISLEMFKQHQTAFTKNKAVQTPLHSGGHIHYRAFSERHFLTPESIALLQKAVRENSYETYKQYAVRINDRSKNLCTLRGLFNLKAGEPIPLEEVEAVDSIVKRFITSAMSFGSISKEAHETMAIAMNRLGAASNSGEGGEDEERYKPLPNGDSSKSMIKQVASGRFGVTSSYLANSRELQIKMAQGAKPGEGGQLPGHKVDEVIAKVRYSTPGVMLISPPPHHDIYSIEDLAQLIFDLKNANPMARISVKLVSEVGVGTIAAGVAKGKADMVLISGHDGGTGASPISSIKYAGIPWEIGLAEAQQTLVLNKLRDRIRVQVDGQLRSGRDVVIGALLGAEEFGFGTVSLVTLGCIMMRKCHLNTCPVGVATQDPELRKRFTGKPEYVVNFMRFIAQDVREIMATLGFRKFEDMVGHVECLETEDALRHWKTEGLDFSKVLTRPEMPKGSTLHCVTTQKHDFSNCLDGELIVKAQSALEEKKAIRLFAPIRNSNRTVGATLSFEVSKRYGSKGLPSDTIYCKFNGSAGQSFGAFLAPGITFEIEGDANDYFGKGLSGGKIIIYPPKSSTFRPQNNIITGNVNLFGATSGEVYINGMAGERFAVRNSGAITVVEGVGDHGCEYMTGGIVVVLGKTGINFAAGMSGGIAYVLDEDQLFDTKCNLDMVDIEPVMDKEDHDRLFQLIQNHVRYTGSEYAGRIIRDWSEMFMQFVKVMPIDYRRALERLKKQEFKQTETVAITEEVYNR